MRKKGFRSRAEDGSGNVREVCESLRTGCGSPIGLRGYRRPIFFGLGYVTVTKIGITRACGRSGRRRRWWEGRDPSRFLLRCLWHNTGSEWSRQGCGTAWVDVGFLAERWSDCLWWSAGGTKQLRTLIVSTGEDWLVNVRSHAAVLLCIYPMSSDLMRWTVDGSFRCFCRVKSYLDPVIASSEFFDERFLS